MALGVVFLVSFGAAGEARAQGQGEGVSLNLRNADLNSVIEIISQATQKTFIVDPRVRGNVTIIAQQKMTPEEAYEVFLNVLELNRFTVVEGESAVRIVPAQIAKEISGISAKGDKIGHGFVTRVLRTQYIDAAKLVELVRPLLPAESSISAHSESGFIVVSDREANIGRVSALIENLDASDSKDFDVIRLENASVSAVADTVNAMELASLGLKISLDARTNSIIVGGPKTLRHKIRDLAERLDQPLSQSRISVIPLRYAEAEELAGVISQLYGASSGGGEQQQTLEVAVVADSKTNSLIITAPPDVLPTIRAAVNSIDRRPAQVLIEAVIFEISADRFAELSLQFGAAFKEVFAGGVQLATAAQNPLSTIAAAMVAGRPRDVAGALGGVRGGIAGGAYVDKDKNFAAAGLLTALASDASANILSTPSVMTLDNEEAEIVVAKKVPFVTGRFSTVGEDAIPNQPFQTIQREDVGLTLRVTPQITVDGTIRLKIAQEVSNLTSVASAAGGEITNRRAINTNVIVADANLILLGGLVQEQGHDIVDKVPVLGDAPLIGQFFRAKSVNKEKRALLLLRPSVMRDDHSAAVATFGKIETVRKIDVQSARHGDDNWPHLERSGLDSLPDHLPQDASKGGSWALPLPPALPSYDSR